jgi:hypothetical protein
VNIGDIYINFNSFVPYVPGDRIMITQPVTPAWLRSVNFGGVQNEKWNSQTFYPVSYYRKVVAVQGKRVRLDAPIMTRLRRQYAISYAIRMEPFKRTNIVTHVGLEDLSVRIQSKGGVDESHYW